MCGGLFKNDRTQKISALTNMKIQFMPFVFLLTVVLSACNKKYTCVCSGYGGSKDIKKYNFRTDSYDGAKQYCNNYALTTGSGGITCELE